MPRVVPEYKEEARNRIVSIASQVFTEKGYRQSTMEDVAKKMGVSKGALYLYFASKEELFEAICRSEPNHLRDILYSSFNQDRDPLESASEFFDKMMDRYGANYGF
ncbi:MAG TPA: TetR/AcrR family transcriptional regulator, partial [Candidatus Binatus sp.]|nr:TetR/AcrR family transcriptional regulator [Candidatus Binatus sp.]